MLPPTDKWSPLPDSTVVADYVDQFRTSLSQRDCVLNSDLLARVADLLTIAIAPLAEEIVEKDSLPSLCHLLNGWGNINYLGKPLILHYGAFLQKNSRNEFGIPQCHPEGDYHAGQSLAYALMAGLTLEEPISTIGVTLGDALSQVREIAKDDPAELGHLLFAWGWSQLPDIDRDFQLGTRTVKFRDLLTEAIDSHNVGHFNVCRKFHLTEGLCAMSFRDPSDGQLRDAATRFLRGQLETLYVVGAIREEITNLCSGQGDQSILQELRENALLGDFLENEFYYVGHAAELFGLAIACGFNVRSEYWNLLVYLVNGLNLDIVRFLPNMDLRESFLHLGHYRRGVTLLAELYQGHEITPRSLRTFTANLSSTQVTKPAHPSPLALSGYYKFATSKAVIDPRLQAIVDEFNTIRDSQAPAAKGNGFHFRRINPPLWPRGVHYEFLVTDREIGAELHIEIPSNDANYRSYMRVIEKLSDSEPSFLLCNGTWLGNGIRIAHLFPVDTEPCIVAKSMISLIDRTFSELRLIAEGHAQDNVSQ